MNASLRIAQLVLRHQLTRARLGLWVAVTFIVVLLGIVVGREIGTDAVEQREAATGLTFLLGLGLVVPVIALVFGSSSLGDLQDDETMVYVWLRPVRRWTVVVGAIAAVMVVVVPASVAPFAIATLAITRDPGTLAGVVLSTALAAAAYGAVFTVVGLRVRRSLIWGLVYVFIWEFFVATAASGAARISINAYPASVLAELSDIPDAGAVQGLTSGLIVPVVVVVVAVAVGSWLLERLDVA